MFKQFHYGVCYYPEHWPASRHESDFRRMREAGFDLVRMGEGAWGYWEPQEGKFQFEMFDRAIDFCRKLGIKVVMGTPTYAAPAWVASNYPEVLRWNFERIPMKHGGRRNFNYTSPKYYELSDRICTAMAEHYKDEPQIVGWQLDNEFNCHMDVSYAPSDTIAFRQWLRDKYKTIGRLNQAWGTAFWSQQYDAWEQIDLPHPTVAFLNPSQLLDETRFISDCVIKFARRQASILRRHNAKWLITHNALFSNVNGPDLAGVLDFFSHDQYPLFNNSWMSAAHALVQARSFSFPYAILEQQSGPGGQMSYFHPSPKPGQLRLWSWQSVAHGAKLISYFRWRTCPYGSEQHWHGLLDPDNRDTRRLAEAKLTGDEFRKLPGDFFDAPPVKTAAIVRDFDNDANDRRINTYNRTGRFEEFNWLSALMRHHIGGDQVWPSSDFRGYRLIVAPHLRIMTPELTAKLESYVRAGGTLVLGAQSGLKDINCHLVETPFPGLLARLAGVTVEEWSIVSGEEKRAARLIDGEQFMLGTFIERLNPTTAKPIAYWAGGDPIVGQSPAVTVNQFGKGRVFYIGGYCPEASVQRLLDLICNMLGIQSIIGAGDDVEVVHRAGARGEYLVLLNHSPAPQRISGLPAAKPLHLDGTTQNDELLLDGYGIAVLEKRGASKRRK